MNRHLLSTALVTAMLLAASASGAATFSYHGTLQDAGKPAEGNYDIELTLYSAPTGGSVIGGPLILHDVPVHKGSFNTQADFGPLAKSFSQAYVATSVRPHGQGDFVSLNTRAEISASPDTNACPGAWSLQGNGGNLPTYFLGTVDTQPLTFQVNATQVGQIVSSTVADSPNIVFGSSTNSAGTTYNGITVSGGGEPGSNCGANQNQACANQVAGNFVTIGGGRGNSAGSNLGYDTIAGGEGNQANGGWTTVGGGLSNNASGEWSTIAGGIINQATGDYSTVGGGWQNSASGPQSTVSGGYFNYAAAASSTVGGGNENQAVGYAATVGGGNDNVAGGFFATVAGGYQNVANGYGATVAGGAGNTAGGDYSFAGGYQAVVRSPTGGTCTSGTNCGDAGTFVWADASGVSSNSSFTSTGPNQFLVQATGGVAINGTPALPNDELTIYGNGVGGSNNVDVDLFPYGATQGFSLLVSGGKGENPAFAIQQTDGATTYKSVLSLDSTGDLTISGGTATKPGGGSWTNPSDRRIKQDITPIDDALDTVLKLRPVNFHYTPEYRAMAGGLADKGYQGFIAQEFADVFPEAVTTTDKQVPGAAAGDAPILALDPNPALITTVAAVQELAVQNQANVDDIATLKQENAALRESLKQQNAALSAVLVRLNQLESQQAH